MVEASRHRSDGLRAGAVASEPSTSGDCKDGRRKRLMVLPLRHQAAKPLSSASGAMSFAVLPWSVFTCCPPYRFSSMVRSCSHVIFTRVIHGQRRVRRLHSGEVQRPSPCVLQTPAVKLTLRRNFEREGFADVENNARAWVHSCVFAGVSHSSA